MKKFLLYIFITSTLIAKGQNDPNITQWMFMRSAFNPAATGANKGLDIAIWDREQWMGLEGRPSTQMLNLGYFIGGANSGLGITVAYDRLGFQSNLTARLNYAYHIILGEKMYLSFGVSGGIVNTTTQFSKLNFGTPNTDPLTANMQENNIAPDIAAGIELYHKNFQIGVSGMHLLGSNKSAYPTFARNLFAYANYSINIGENVRIVPGIIGRSPLYLFQFEGNLVGYFLKDRFWIGAAYRYNDAVSGIAGVQIVKGLRLGYSFDFSMGRLQNYNTGTHEFMLSYAWKKPRKPQPFFNNPRNY